MPVTLAHLSDLHLGQDHGGDGGARALSRAERVVAHLNGMRGDVDAVLVTGDITDHGTPEEYRQARELLDSLRFRVLTCPGNHDDRVAYQTTLLGEPSGAGDPVNHVHEVGGLTIAMCDATIPGRAEGRFADGTLRWLDEVLASGDGPALVCLHHPPVPLHHPVLDDIGLLAGERLADALTDRVLAVLCGHAHTSAVATFAGRPLIVAPGVVSTCVLPFESDEVLSYDLPPSIAFHVVDDRGLVTHYRSL